MNHQYRLIWNDKVNGWIVASEIVSSRGKRSSKASRARAAILSALLGLGSASAFANPSGGQVVGGSASISSAGNEVTINQTSDKAIINWQSFSIDSHETTRFVQPSSSSIALNRITGQDPSRIFGALVANGNIFLVNPNGIIFGTNARIDVNGLVATTHDITNENFMAGNYKFDIPGRADASIINQGSITMG